jgi:CelD/BcsL family acetyltransferase involved in cellulose biosynthesis
VIVAPEPRIAVARSSTEIEALRPSWEALPGGAVTTDPEVFLSMLGPDGRAARPYVVQLEENGTRALAVGRLERMPLSAKIGYRTVYAPRVDVLTIVYRGLLGDASEEASARVLGRLRQALADGEADVLRLRSLRIGSPLHRLATSAPSYLSRQHVSKRTAHWQLALPGSFDEFLRSLSSRTREGVRRYSRKLERDYGDRLSLQRLAGEAELERFFVDARRVAEKTYQHGLGVAVGDDPAHRRLIEAAAGRGWFRAWVLSIDGEPAAFWHGFAYRGEFAIGIPGYDPAYAQQRVGTYVLMRAIEELCADEDVHTVDFGFGEAEYKRRFGTERWEEEDVLVYATTFRGVRVNLTRTAVLRSAAAARTLAERAPGLRRRWRARLARGGER